MDLILEQEGGNKKRAAEILGIDRRDPIPHAGARPSRHPR